MKKYSVIFALSFISYFIVLFEVPYVLAQTWADMHFPFFLISIIYQFCYIVFLRKIDKVSFGRSVSLFFLYAFVTGSFYAIIQYVDIYINGYLVTTMFTNEIVATYYGLDAWRNSTFENIIFLPFLVISFIYVVIYFMVNNEIKKSKISS